MTLLINLLFFFSQNSYGVEGMPKCVRPTDFSMGKFVASYEACLVRQKNYCNAHRESKECAALPVESGRPYFKVTVDDIDPTKRCSVQKDGSYKCLQDPVRFMTPAGASAAGVPAVTSTPSTVAVPLEENSGGTNADSSPAPAAMPSAGPGPLMHPPVPRK